MMQRKLQKSWTLFFSTVADKIGHNVVYDPSTHPSIVEIKNHVDIDNNFDFQKVYINESFGAYTIKDIQ
jgi:hypothetical protein